MRLSSACFQVMLSAHVGLACSTVEPDGNADAGGIEEVSPDTVASELGGGDSDADATNLPTWLTPTEPGLRQLLTFATLGEQSVVALSWDSVRGTSYTRVDERGASLSTSIVGGIRWLWSATRCGVGLCVVGESGKGEEKALTVDRVSVESDGELTVTSRVVDAAFDPFAGTSSVLASSVDPPEWLMVDDDLGTWRRCALGDDVVCTDLVIESPCDLTITTTELDAYAVDGARAFVAGTCSSCGDVCGVSGGIFLIEVDLQTGVGTHVIAPAAWPGRMRTQLFQDPTHLWLVALWLPNGSSDSGPYPSALTVVSGSRGTGTMETAHWDGPTHIGWSEVSGLGVSAPEGLFLVSTSGDAPDLRLTAGVVTRTGVLTTSYDAPLPVRIAESTYPRMLSLVRTEVGYLGALWTDEGTWTLSFDSEGRPRVD